MISKTGLNLLKELVESFGPSGFEREPAIITRKAVKSYADDITLDKLGSVIFTHKGTAERPRVLLPGHIDEVGFVISGIDEKTGFLTFNPLGGWWIKCFCLSELLSEPPRAIFMALYRPSLLTY